MHKSFVVYGPVPPPANGFSIVTRRMIELLRSKGRRVDLADRSPKGGLMRAVFSAVSCSIRLLFRNDVILYVALSGGSRQVLDLLAITAARLRNLPVIVHHHSFAYINRPTKLAQLCIRVAGGRHIMLCECMAERLRRSYRLPNLETAVVSNAAFIEFADRPTRVLRPFTIGFLSNISFEKGIDTFFELMTRLDRDRSAVRGVVAGPVPATLVDWMSYRLGEQSQVRHVGAVYGADKEEFFRSIDVLFFPTRYVNEAEPVTILEALSYGVPTVSFDRGCVPSLANQSGLGCIVVKDVNEAISSIAMIRDAYEEASRAAADRFLQLRADGLAELSRLIDQPC